MIYVASDTSASTGIPVIPVIIAGLITVALVFFIQILGYTQRRSLDRQLGEPRQPSESQRTEQREMLELQLSQRILCKFFAGYKLAIFSLLSLANVALWPYVFLSVSNIGFHWNNLTHNFGLASFVVGESIALALPIVSWGILWRAAARHQQHSSWPSRATASRRCRSLFVIGYFITGTIASAGISSWSSAAARSQVFVALFLAGGFAVVTVVGTRIADGIGRSMMAWRFNTGNVPCDPAVAVFADGDAVLLVFADGRNENVTGTNFKDEKNISWFFDTIVTASLQEAQRSVLLVNECGDVFRNRIGQDPAMLGSSAEATSTASRAT